MSNQREKAARFLALHHGPRPLLLANAWDGGSAAILASLGFEALATTSSGHAATLGRLDGSVSRDEAIGHGAAIVAATELPVSADLEDCFPDAQGGVAETIRRALAAGLAGCSIEDYGGEKAGIYPLGLAAERVAAAAAVAHSGPIQLVLTARAENHIRGRDDLDDTIARLQSYEAAGADVLYAPGLTGLDEISRVVAAITRPLNVLVRPGLAPVGALAQAGVGRISVGGAFAFTALAALVDAAAELRDAGTYGFLERAAAGAAVAREAFVRP